MKIARCAFQGDVWWGEVLGDEVSLLVRAAQAPVTELGSSALSGLSLKRVATVGIDDVELLAPTPSPSKVICVGLNYRDHAEESGLDLPERPMIFAKYPSSICGPGASIVLPDESTEVDWEVELAIVVGRLSRDVAESASLRSVLGYTVSNDVSARDLQIADGQFVRAKSFDTFCPVGPWITTVDELGDAADLGIGLEVNSKSMQDSNTSEMVFSVPEIVSFCSRVATLNPGDLILTGTPAGTGFGLDPQEYLDSGDEVTAWIDGIGQLRNPVVAA